MPDSPPLSDELRAAAAVIAGVLAGRNLDGALAGVSATLRPAVQELSYGSLRQFGRGDFFLRRLVRKPLAERKAHALLLAALYRLEARPGEAHTIVNQAVEAAAGMAGGRYQSLVNAVLRSFLRQRETLRRDCEADRTAHWQHPSWWIDRLEAAYPEAWTRILEAGNEHPPMTLRVNRRRIAVEDYRARLSEAGLEARWLGGAALKLDQPASVGRLPGFADGWASVQDFGAQRAAELLAPADGMRVLDACAAPGGKTAHLLESAEIDLLALDADAVRLQRVRDNLDRLGLHATLAAADCGLPETWWDGCPFDRILADVPCTASGVVRRHPDAKWLRREGDIARFAATQRRMLDALWPLLAPGGRLLYCTCSIFPQENVAQVASFLRRRQEAAVAGIMDALRISELQLLPTADHDGFFYAVIEKRD